MVTKQRNSNWTDEELLSSVETYLYILRLELAGAKYSISEITDALQKDFLPNRNQASIRYRMRNISWVFSVNGLSTIPAYSPAPQVGSGVRERIEKILGSRPDIKRFLTLKINPKRSSQQNSVEKNRKNALDQLDKLFEALEDIERPPIGIGHNRPPDPIENILLSEISETRRDIKLLKAELEKSQPNTEQLEEGKSRLIIFGLKLVNWTGGRLTSFTDAVLTSFAAVAIAKMTNVLPLLLDAIEAIGRLIP